MANFNETDRHFIGLLQDTINRMASNSANCKTWLLAIITAVVAFVATNKSAVNLLWIIVIVDVLFYLLDSYYLQLERNFRDLESDFVGKVRAMADDNNRLDTECAYDFNFKRLDTPDVKINRKNMKEALTSYSTWPFYLVIMAATLIMIFVLSDINIHICIKCCCCCCY